MLDILRNYTFWFVLIAILLVIIYVWSNYNMKPKKKDRKRSGNEEDSSTISSSENSTETSESLTNDSSSSPSCSHCSNDEEYSGSESNVPETKYDVNFTPHLPNHIRDPNYKPEFFYNAKSPSKGEVECKAAAERIFGVPFHTVRPNWLKNVRNMEIDCYNEELGLGIEFHGVQHYRYNKKFHNGKLENLHKQIERDILKIKLCHENKKHLIVVPFNVPIDQIEAFIRYADPRALEQRNKLGVVSLAGLNETS